MADRRLERLLTDLEQCQQIEDAEIAHEMADAALIAYVRDTSGDERVVAAFKLVRKWYA